MSCSNEDDIQLTEVEIENEPTAEKRLDDLVHLRRYFGRVFLMSTLAVFTSMASSTFMVFAGDNPAIIGCGEFKINNCQDLRALQNTTGCSPVLGYQFESVQVEFLHICEDSKLVKNTITIQAFGVLLGAIAFGLISDNFGRRRALIIATLGGGIASIGAAYTTDLVTFTIVRTICGFFTGGLTVVQMVYKVEQSPKKHRMWINNVLNYSPMLIVFSMLAYGAENWRSLSTYIGYSSFFTFLSVLPLYESPRWLLQKNEIEKARLVLVNIQKIDRMYTEETGIEIDEILGVEMSKLSETDEKYTFFHLFCTRKLIAQTLTFLTGIICTSAVVYSLMFNMESLSGSLYMKLLLVGASRWAVNILFAVLDYKTAWFGRKMGSYITMAFTIVTIAAISVLTHFGIDRTVLTTCTIIASAMCAQLLNLKFLMVGELYPTAVRNLAMSAVSTMSRVGTTFSAQIFYLDGYAAWLPYIVIFCLQIYDLFVFAIFIPETKGVDLNNQLPPRSERLFGRRGRQ